MKKVFMILMVLAMGATYFHFHNIFPATADLPENENYPAITSHYSYDALLTDEAKEAYEKIEKSVYGTPGKDNTLCEINNIDKTQFHLACEAFKDDHPDVFWMREGFITEGFEVTGGYVESRYPKETLEKMKEEFKDSIADFTDTLPSGLDQEMLEEYAHSWILNHCEYDYTALSDSKAYRDGSVKKMSDTTIEASKAYGALVKGNAVCSGYAQAYQLLLNRVGVECVPIRGQGQALDGIRTGGADHAWNAVKRGSEWRMTDVTWDDSGYDDHRYFNLSIAEMYYNHNARVLDQTNYQYIPYFNSVLDGDCLFLPEQI